MLTQMCPIFIQLYPKLYRTGKFPALHHGVAQREYKTATREYGRVVREQQKSTKKQEGAVSEHAGSTGEVRRSKREQGRAKPTLDKAQHMGARIGCSKLGLQNCIYR